MKVLIVEDDFVVRQGICLSLEWEDYGLSICGDATNGKQGLEMAEALNPDIILTDIRMPIMDGLKFAENVLKILPDVKIIILSGYDDFAYAKQALRIGVDDYLLKPVDAEELLQCVCSLRDEILRERNINQYREMLERECEPELFDRIMENFLHPLLPEERERIQKELSVIGGTVCESTVYQIMVLVIENFQILVKNHTREEKRAFSEEIKHIAAEMFDKKCNALCFANGVGEFVLLLGYENASRICLEECCRNILQKLGENSGIKCTVGCGTEKISIDEIHLSYQEALTALYCQGGQGDGQIFYYTGDKQCSSVVKQAMDYVQENYNKELTVKSISTELFITPNYFSHIFKSETGKNFTDYVNEVRIHWAKKLLKDNSLKVYEVAEQLGYQNYKYFNRVFKKYTGYSPKEYGKGR